MYNRELETDAAAKQLHDDNLKKAAAERLAKNAKWNKENKKKKDKPNDGK